MASQSWDEESTPLSFLEFTRAYYKQDQNCPIIETVDTMLIRDIRNYERYLNDRRAFDELSIFLELRGHIQTTNYDFVPQSKFQGNTPPPSFSDFNSQYTGIGPDYVYPQICNTYSKFITGLVSPETLKAYAVSREVVAEGDRRWLYGLKRNEESCRSIEIHMLRREFREAWEDAASILNPEVLSHVEACCVPRIIQLTILIATDMEIPREEEESITNDLLYAENWILQAREQTSRSSRPAPSCERGEESQPAVELEERDRPLDLYEWRQLVMQAQDNYYENMTLGEFLVELKEEAAGVEAEDEMSEDEDENIHIPRCFSRQADTYYSAAYVGCF
ncbi:hypothetical protein ONS95_000742 [Cadophora gregata]|uniref:uncharacterized protein n=1 Tax=Cadophora gregata TaxID=51156 RepID=UPI0026DAE8DE|nr:uncharacterized protein ONS95_000742 [Cadophora gregata]KAK0103079.1 hypothetical protein ONS96_005690 [Cadophora gregata f. sp. sojae]KAK0128792.1 hypothetical protein ONS95_000742 [Cadophora gregata]